MPAERIGFLPQAIPDPSTIMVLTVWVRLAMLGDIKHAAFLRTSTASTVTLHCSKVLFVKRVIRLV